MNSTIYTNMDSVRNYNVFNNNASNASRAMERATTGLKIASAKDNASQYAISAKMLERINSNTQASQNVQNDNALLKTAEDGIANTVSILQTLKARAIDAANDSNTDADRANIQKEVDRLIDQIDDNSKNVKYNGKTLLDGTFAEKVTCATKAASFVQLDSATAAKKLSEYFSNTTGPALAVATWTDKDGVAQNATRGFTASSHTLSQVLTSADLLSGSALTVSQVSDTSGGNISSLTDKDGNNVSVAAPGFAAVATAAGTGFSSLAITISVGSNKQTFTFGEIQQGKAINTNSAQALTFQVGEEQGFKIDNVNIEDMGKTGLGIGSINVSTKTGANGAIGTIDTALKRALAQQTDIGALEQRLGFTADTLDTINENLQASASTIRDADMAKEISTYMKWNVLMQASQYMLAQSNQNAYSVVNLLQ